MSEMIDIGTLKVQGEELLSKLAEESEAIGKEERDAWKSSSKPKRVAELVGEITKLEFELARVKISDSEERTFIERRIRMRRLELNHEIDNERLLASQALGSTFRRIVDVAADLAKAGSKDIVLPVIVEALKGVAGKIV